MPTSPPPIEEAAGRSPLVRAALETAEDAHSGQTRNASGGRPYIEHPVAVAAHLAVLGCDDEVLAAALLHDVVEDTDLEVEDVRRRTDDTVAGMVDALTDDPSIEPWRRRKAEHRERVEAAGGGALAIYAADKLTNVEMLRDAYRLQGEGVGAELKVSLDEKVAIWEEDLEMLSALQGADPRVSGLAGRLAAQLEGLRADRLGRADPARG